VLEKVGEARKSLEREDRVTAQRRFEEGYGQIIVGRMRQQNALLITCLEHIQAVLSPYSVCSIVRKSEPPDTTLYDEKAEQEKFIRLENSMLKALKDLTGIHRKFELRCSALESSFKSYTGSVLTFPVEFPQI